MAIPCKRCGRPLYWDEIAWDDEASDDICGPCGDKMYENYRFRQEWNEYHDEPCPDEELPHPLGSLMQGEGA